MDKLVALLERQQKLVEARVEQALTDLQKLPHNPESWPSRFIDRLLFSIRHRRGSSTERLLQCENAILSVRSALSAELELVMFGTAALLTETSFDFKTVADRVFADIDRIAEQLDSIVHRGNIALVDNYPSPAYYSTHASTATPSLPEKVMCEELFFLFAECRWVLEQLRRWPLEEMPSDQLAKSRQQAREGKTLNLEAMLARLK